MKRILVVLFIMLIISCVKQKSDLQIIESENTKEVIKETTPEAKHEETTETNSL
jgi:hypothetical protein